MRGAQLGRLQPGRTVIPIATKRLYGSSASGESPNLVALDVVRTIKYFAELK